MDLKQINLIFGALLHDIGKVVYRGSSEQGTHSTLGANFIKEMANTAEDPSLEAAYGPAILEQIRYHHAMALAGASVQEDSLAYLTYFADNISAGMDRKDLPEEGSNEPTASEAGGARFDRTAKLRKIFNILNGHHDDNTKEHEDYNTLREEISKSLKAIEVSERGVGSILNLLERTCASVPSSTDTTQLIDVSLFDHAKTTAGVAACLYDYLMEQGITNYKAALFNKETSQEYYSKDMFLLWSCDMSGIQSFIYNISGEKALKQLRARSFYLELLLEHIVDELLERLALTRCNLLFTGGGHAYMLLPNTTHAQETLAAFSEDLKEWFLENYRTDLYLAQAFVECSADDLANGNLASKAGDKQRYRRRYQTLSQKLSAEKAQRYSAADIQQLNFGNAEHDHTRECKECHRSDVKLNADDVCRLCESFAAISADCVRKDVFVVEQDGALLLPFDKKCSVYTVGEYRAQFSECEKTEGRVYTKNRWDTGLGLATHLWMGDYTATTQEGISDYASSGLTLDPDDDGNELGIKRLGVLRADVDNLGAIFTSGLPDDKISISRTATLSRELSYFFKCELNAVLARGGERGAGYQAQIIYSGGDDLFIIGNWSDVLSAAMDIRQALDEFTGNRTLTISAGVGMYDAHYPIARMAAEVGELEDAAKNYCNSESKDGLPSKNAIALWSPDAVFSWDDFTDKVYGKLDDISSVFDENEKGKAFIYKLISLLCNTDDAISIPRLAYLLARSFEDKKGGAQTSEKFFNWAIDEQERKYLIAALEWYVYSMRERG